MFDILKSCISRNVQGARRNPGKGESCCLKASREGPEKGGERGFQVVAFC
jgi:hypothetical protein